MSETAFERVIRKTGKKPVACKCVKCKAQCTRTPCLGTPEDILKLIEAGYADRLASTIWGAGMTMGLMTHPVEIVAPLYDHAKGACTFFNNGLCDLHDLGLKPTEGRLSSHEPAGKGFTNKKNIAWNVVKEWINIDKERLNKLLKMVLPTQNKQQ